MSYVLALDEGTTSARAIIFDQQGLVCAVAQREFKQYFPQNGWVEHDPQEIWSAQISVAVEALSRARLQPRDISAVGITNQRETTVVWDRTTGNPVCNAIVWQDRRTADWCARLVENGHADLIQERTGLVIDAYFSASKLVWMLDHLPGVRQRAEAGQLMFGTIDTWLLWKLTSGRLHLTDASNASRTMLFNIHTGTWDEELLNLFSIPASMLPTVVACSQEYGEISTTLGLGGIMVAGMAGDQQAALFGQLCLAPGDTKNTYGTGCFMLQNAGETAIRSRHRLLTTVAWKIGDRTEYALEGSVFVGGAVVQWLRDGLGIIQSASEIEALARSVPDHGGVLIVPAFAGLGAPHWDGFARGTIVGLTRGSTKAHLARAALDSIAYQSADLLEAMQRDTGKPLTELRVDGGAARNDLLMQFQADLLGAPVVRPAVTETTALGAAYLAGLAVGVWKNPDELARQWQVERRFEPQLPRDQVAELRAQWRRAVERSRAWEPRESL